MQREPSVVWDGQSIQPGMSQDRSPEEHHARKESSEKDKPDLTQYHCFPEPYGAVNTWAYDLALGIRMEWGGCHSQWVCREWQKMGIRGVCWGKFTGTEDDQKH